MKSVMIIVLMFLSNAVTPNANARNSRACVAHLNLMTVAFKNQAKAIRHCRNLEYNYQEHLPIYRRWKRIVRENHRILNKGIRGCYRYCSRDTDCDHSFSNPYPCNY